MEKPFSYRFGGESNSIFERLSSRGESREVEKNEKYLEGKNKNGMTKV